MKPDGLPSDQMNNATPKPFNTTHLPGFVVPRNEYELHKLCTSRNRLQSVRIQGYVFEELTEKHWLILDGEIMMRTDHFQNGAVSN